MTAVAADERAWQDCLDRFAAFLADQRAALAGARPEDIAAFDPGPLGPLPDWLGPRARELHAEAVALQTALAAARDDVRRQLRFVTTMGRSGSGTAYSPIGLLDDRG